MKKNILLLSAAFAVLSITSCMDEDEIKVNNFSTLVFHSDLNWPRVTRLYPVDDAEGGVYALMNIQNSLANHTLNGNPVSFENLYGDQLIRLTATGNYEDSYALDGEIPEEIAIEVENTMFHEGFSQHEGFARKVLADGSVIEVRNGTIGKSLNGTTLWINALNANHTNIRRLFIDVDDAGNTYVLASDEFRNEGTSLIGNYGDFVSIHKFDQNGEQVWSKEIQRFGEQVYGFVYAGGMAVGDGVLYLTGYGTIKSVNKEVAFIRKYSLDNGSMIWEQEPRAEDNSTYDHYYYFFPEALTVDSDNNVWVSLDWSFSDWSVGTIPHGTPDIKIIFGNNVIEGNTYTNNVTYHLLAKFNP